MKYIKYSQIWIIQESQIKVWCSRLLKALCRKLIVAYRMYVLMIVYRPSVGCLLGIQWHLLTCRRGVECVVTFLSLLRTNQAIKCLMALSDRSHFPLIKYRRGPIGGQQEVSHSPLGRECLQSPILCQSDGDIVDQWLIGQHPSYVSAQRRQFSLTLL